MYEYACRACGNEFEARQKISDEPIKTCPKCGQDTVERLVSRSSFALKGSGWYSDGYGASSKTEKTDAKPKSDSTKSEAPKAEKAEKAEKVEKAEKPAPKAEAKSKDSGD
jgi:putative FmdB family regulatory protein